MRIKTRTDGQTNGVHKHFLTILQKIQNILDSKIIFPQKISAISNHKNLLI